MCSFVSCVSRMRGLSRLLPRRGSCMANRQSNGAIVQANSQLVDLASFNTKEAV